MLLVGTVRIAYFLTLCFYDNVFLRGCEPRNCIPDRIILLDHTCEAKLLLICRSASILPDSFSGNHFCSDKVLPDTV